MASTTMTDTRPKFSRLTEGRSTNAWRAALPAVVVVAAFVALLGYLASAMSTYEQRWMNAVRESQGQKNQIEGMGRQIAQLQKDEALLKTPGRTTVVLEAADKKTKTWAAATWGEMADGKTVMRVNAYGLGEKPEGKTFHAWFVPQSGDPVDLGDLEPDGNGSSWTMGTELPAVDQGKSVEVTADASGAKKPGDVLARIDLPKLEPSKKLPSAEPAGQGKTDNTSKEMHQQGK
jgi:anti-sigma-K factor RskA